MTPYESTTTRVLKFIAETRKASAALVAVLTLALAQGLLSDPLDKWATGLIAILTPLAVYGTRNAEPSPKGEPEAAEPEDEGTYDEQPPQD